MDPELELKSVEEGHAEQVQHIVAVMSCLMAFERSAHQGHLLMDRLNTWRKAHSSWSSLHELLTAQEMKPRLYTTASNPLYVGGLAHHHIYLASNLCIWRVLPHASVLAAVQVPRAVPTA
jgi:hypothetical protein